MISILLYYKSNLFFHSKAAIPTVPDLENCAWRGHNAEVHMAGKSQMVQWFNDGDPNRPQKKALIRGRPPT